MFTSPINRDNPGTSPVPSTLLRYWTMRVLATAMVVALAVLASIGGKESQSRQLSFNKGTIGDPTIKHQDQGRYADVTKPKKSSPMISWQTVATMVKSLKEAFNDPSLVEYANQQGIDTSGSTTAPSKSSSSQSSRSSLSH